MNFTAIKPGALVKAVPHAAFESGKPIVEGYVNEVFPTYLLIRGLGYTQFQATDYRVYVLREPKPPIVLPTEPGTVIAIGDWWLVKLRPYTEYAEGAWELLPAPETANKRMQSLGVKAQCVYGSDWVLAEAQQEGGFRIISAPERRSTGGDS